MGRRLVWLCLMLAACATPGKRNAAAMAIYDLGSPMARSASTAGQPPLMLEVRAPTWIDSVGIAYRLAYAEPGRLRAYAQARWAGPPTQLMQQRLVQELGFVAGGQGSAKCQVRVDLDEFAQIFEASEKSSGVLRARVALLDRGRAALAERRVHFTQVASTQDSRGGVSALTAAVDQFGEDLGRWLDELARSNQLKACND